LGSLSAPPDPVAAKQGPTSKGRVREGREGDRMGGEGGERTGGDRKGGERKRREGKRGRGRGRGGPLTQIPGSAPDRKKTDFQPFFWAKIRFVTR